MSVQLVPSAYSCNEEVINTNVELNAVNKKQKNTEPKTKVKDEHTSYIHCKKLIGEGSFKKTYLGTLVTTLGSGQTESTDIVYQKIKKHLKCQIITNDELLKEVETQKKFTHEHIVKIYDHIIYEPKDKLVIYSEKCDQDLKTAILEKKLNFREKLQVIQDIASALVTVHTGNYGHNDVKADNLFLKDGRGKLSDFGLATPFGEKLTFVCNPIVAPEQKKPNKPISSEKADVYQFGLTLWNLFHKDPIPVHFDKKFIYPTDDVASVEDSRIQTLLKDCINPLPKERPTMQEVADRLAAINEEKEQERPTMQEVTDRLAAINEEKEQASLSE